MDAIFRIDVERSFHNCGALTANDRPPYALNLHDWGKRRLSFWIRGFYSFTWPHYEIILWFSTPKIGADNHQSIHGCDWLGNTLRYDLFHWTTVSEGGKPQLRAHIADTDGNVTATLSTLTELLKLSQYMSQYRPIWYWRQCELCLKPCVYRGHMICHI